MTWSACGTFTTFHRIVLAGALVWIINGLAPGMARAAQDPPAEFIAMSVRPETMGSSYPVLTDDERVGHWVYPGEPVSVEVTVGNHTKQVLRLDGEWYTKVRLAVRPLPAGFRGGSNTASPVSWTWQLVGRRRGARQPEGEQVILPPGAVDTIQFVLEAPTPPPVGIYELRLDWLVPLLSGEQTSRTRLERGGGSLLGVRGIDTRADQLNQAGHLALWAQSRKDYVVARAWLQKMLQLNPSSVAAFSNLGNIAAANGDCREAVARWEKARQLIGTDGDPDAVPLSRWAKDDILGGLARQIENCRK